MAVIAAVIIYRTKWRILRLPAAAVTSYLAVLLLLCKTMGAAVYAIVAAPLALFTTPRTWVRLACAILLLVCAYPLLRTYEVIPVHHIAAAAKMISVDRSASFQTRVKNEDMLLSKASEKPLFGWGTWGRSRVSRQAVRIFQSLMANGLSSSACSAGLATCRFSAYLQPQCCELERPFAVP